MNKNFLLRSCLVLSSALTLSACDHVVKIVAFSGDKVLEFFQGEDVNLVQHSYAAADYLTQQIDSYMTKYDPLYIEPLTVRGADNLSSQFGYNVSAQIGERLRQLGYNVMQDSDINMGLPDKGFVLGGDYVMEDKVKISLRTTRLSDKRVIAAFDYMMPKDVKISRMAKPQPRIFRATN